jgi:hypothetical protein
MSLARLGVSTLDWLFSGAALFVLLPGSEVFRFPGFLGVFMLAQIAGLVAQLPGGMAYLKPLSFACSAGRSPSRPFSAPSWSIARSTFCFRLVAEARFGQCSGPLSRRFHGLFCRHGKLGRGQYEAALMLRLTGNGMPAKMWVCHNLRAFG